MRYVVNFFEFAKVFSLVVHPYVQLYRIVTIILFGKISTIKILIIGPYSMLHFAYAVGANTFWCY